jgi:hypothetical protein
MSRGLQSARSPRDLKIAARSVALPGPEGPDGPAGALVHITRTEPVEARQR